MIRLSQLILHSTINEQYRGKVYNSHNKIIFNNEYLHSHSALSSCPDSTQPQPAHPG